MVGGEGGRGGYPTLIYWSLPFRYAGTFPAWTYCTVGSLSRVPFFSGFFAMTPWPYGSTLGFRTSTDEKKNAGSKLAPRFDLLPRPIDRGTASQSPLPIDWKSDPNHRWTLHYGCLSVCKLHRGEPPVEISPSWVGRWLDC